MKKILSILCVLVLVSLGTVGQDISGGAKAGLNLAKITGDFSDVATRTAFHIGGYANVAFTDQLSLQPELLFNSVGAKEDGGDGKLIYNYISIPIMVQYAVTEMINIQAGPQVGFLVSAKEKYDDEEFDVKDEYKGTDFGFNVGVGADFGQFNAAARYCIGISNIYDDSDFEIKNSVFQISLGVKLFGE